MKLISIILAYVFLTLGESSAGKVEKWGSSATELQGTSKAEALFDKTYDTSANNTPEVPKLTTLDPDQDIETKEAYAPEPELDSYSDSYSDSDSDQTSEQKASETFEGDVSDITEEDDDLEQVDPSLTKENSFTTDISTDSHPQESEKTGGSA